ncbi:angiotensin-converting enzyme-like [Anneissia japonica]|uniref:angiotensin-converting enzyme-like n=1 Tax=Anneissia japonica TaxID=1529436 RepID=UPI0014258B40|nr:angiotensin-converting enzyme-like [Anneissia japonica]
MEVGRMFFWLLILVLFCSTSHVSATGISDELEDGSIDNEILAVMWLQELNTKLIDKNYELAVANWNYETNMTDHNSVVMNNISLELHDWDTEVKKKARKFNTENFSYEIKRMFKLLLQGGELRNDEQVRRYNTITTEMLSIYAHAKVCRDPPSTECLPLEPGLESIMSDSRDYDELLWAWKGWRDAVGPPIGKLYPEYVKFRNIAARNTGYNDESDVWLENYEEDDFETVLDELFQEIKPLYMHLHAYVRRKLRDRYGDRVSTDGPIPAHLLGNMWAQQWDNIYDIVRPFPDLESVDITPTMREQDYTVLQMFHIANNFFTSIGLTGMPPTFWKKSMFVKPRDRDVVCHGSAHDMQKGNDVRIKMCTQINYNDFYTVHHEMGHCEYYLQYRDQPLVFRAGANHGFHEAVGDTIALSVVTPDYLNKMGLLSVEKFTDRHDIDFLLRQALVKIAFLPFGFMIDKWRWDVFRGITTPEDYNSKWWELRTKYQGIEAPVERSSTDFDPGAKYHIPSGTPYIRYFVSFLIQFQFHESLCKEKNHEGPIHRCNIYQSTAAGDRLGAMLRMGASRPWQDAMQEITGQRKIDTSSIKRYFDPLFTWLQEQNYGKDVGWD